MELVKVNLSVSRQKSKAITYVSKEEAFNLNESMEDISRILVLLLQKVIYGLSSRRLSWVQVTSQESRSSMA